jgi:hypothetical protein
VAIDSREKRHSATSLLGWSLVPTVDPTVALFPVSSRQAAAHVYSGITARSGFVGDSRDTVIAEGNRVFIPATPADCVVAGSNRTFTPADD